MLHLDRKRLPIAAFSAIAALAASGAARASTVCVDPAGASGCQTTIGAAVKAASAGDTIQVAPGTYKEQVTIDKPLSLIGAGSATTIIDATGLSNGILIDGSAAPVGNVVVTGFAVMNARLQGILAWKASAVTISNNQVLNNDRGLDASTHTCSGLPKELQAGEKEDCGEGIHLTGADHSVVTNNVVAGNAGGILVSDDVGPTHDNVISGNQVSDNPYDCGITLASHSGKGVYHNTVSGNLSTRNGLKATGAGVGLFAPGPGSQTWGNVVINNTLTGNGHPGVTMHNHAAPPGTPAVSLNDNVIVGNIISGNAADTEDAATAGRAGINIYSVAHVSGIIVTQNVISDEDVGLALNAPGQILASFNNFRTPAGVISSAAGSVQATQNWWGCSSGPSVNCATASGPVTSDAWLTAPFSATQLPGSPLAPPPPPSGGGAVTIMITGPSGATSPTNTFVTVAPQIVLDASQTKSSNAGTLSYSWKNAPGFPTVAIAGGNTAAPTFQLPGRGTYQFVLTVTDAAGATATATVTLERQ